MSLHLPFGIALLLGVVGMSLSDFCGTFLVVAESRGRAKLAGIMDGAGDMASVLVTVAGVGSIFSDGITWHSGCVLLAIFCTSVAGTTFWTQKASKWVNPIARPVKGGVNG